ncbi:MAG TPA: hypothetical protein VF658_06460 [Pyrinomonadaceae bacterium]
MALSVAATVCLSQSALAQSGRRIKRNPSPPRQTAQTETRPETVTAPQATLPAATVNAIIVGAEIVMDGYEVHTNEQKDAIKSCMERLKERPILNVIKGGKMKRAEAMERARLETEAYVLWMEIKTRMVGLFYEEVVVINYYVFTPKTAKVLIEGRLDPKRQEKRIGQVRIPQMPRRTHPAIAYEDQLEEGGRAVADRVRGALFKELPSTLSIP